MSDDRTSFIKTPKQLVVVVVLAFAVPIAVFALLSQLVTDVRPAGRQDAETGVLSRIKPVGEVTLATASAPEAKSGEGRAAPAPSAAPPVPVAAASTAPIAVAAAPAAAAKPDAPLDLKAGLALMQKDGCSACHGVDKKIVGPAYQDVAAKYKGDGAALAKLTQKVKAGGSGVWGPIPMPPNAQVPDADLRVLVSWILALKK
jgi:cytochrome c